MAKIDRRSTSQESKALAGASFGAFPYRTLLGLDRIGSVPLLNLRVKGGPTQRRACVSFSDPSMTGLRWYLRMRMDWASFGSRSQLKIPYITYTASLKPESSHGMPPVITRQLAETAMKQSPLTVARIIRQAYQQMGRGLWISALIDTEKPKTEVPIEKSRWLVGEPSNPHRGADQQGLLAIPFGHRRLILSTYRPAPQAMSLGETWPAAVLRGRDLSFRHGGIPLLLHEEADLFVNLRSKLAATANRNRAAVEEAVKLLTSYRRDRDKLQRVAREVTTNIAPEQSGFEVRGHLQLDSARVYFRISPPAELFLSAGKGASRQVAYISCPITSGDLLSAKYQLEELVPISLYEVHDCANTLVERLDASLFDSRLNMEAEFFSDLCCLSEHCAKALAMKHGTEFFNQSFPVGSLEEKLLALWLATNSTIIAIRAVYSHPWPSQFCDMVRDTRVAAAHSLIRTYRDLRQLCPPPPREGGK